MIKLLPLMGFIDIPNEERKIHNKSIPVGGGIAIILSFLITSLIFFVSFSETGNIKFPLEAKQSLLILLIIIAVMFLGLYDDRFDIKAKYKLYIQVAICFICWLVGVRIESVFGFELNHLSSAILTIIWIGICINAYNLIDGMDGLSAGLGFISLLSLGLICVISGKFDIAIIFFILSASCLGFLRFNFHPARIFMGDTGSTFIGLMIGILSILYSTKIYTFSSTLIPILAAGVPIFDTLLAIWRRYTNRLMVSTTLGKLNVNSKIMGADKEHLHHRLLKKYLNHKKTVLILYLIASLFSIFAILLSLVEDRVAGFFFLIIMLVIFSFIKRLAYVELWNSGKVVLTGLKKPSKGFLLYVGLPFTDFVFILISYCFSFILFSHMSGSPIVSILSSQAIYVLLPIILILNFTRTYRIYWFRSISSDYLSLCKNIFISVFIAFILLLLRNNCENFNLLLLKSLFFLFLTILLSVGFRFFLMHLKYKIYKDYYLKTNIHYPKKGLIIGGELNCKFFLNKSHTELIDLDLDIIGILDKSKSLYGTYIYGFKVIGDIDNLESLVKKFKIEQIIVTLDLDDACMAEILSCCLKHNIKLKEVKLQERCLIDKTNCNSQII